MKKNCPSGHGNYNTTAKGNERKKTEKICIFAGIAPDTEKDICKTPFSPIPLLMQN
jgi:hypothetical protein